MRNSLFIVLVLIATALFTGCKEDSKSDAANTNKNTAASEAPKAKFELYKVDSSKITTIKPGLQVFVAKKGQGRQVKAGDRIVVHYHGTLTNGKVFDSSFERGAPAEFVIGRGQLIKGWDEGIPTLTVGSQAVFIVAPELGYGEKGAGDAIPGNSTLVFYIEVLGNMPGE